MISTESMEGLSLKKLMELLPKDGAGIIKVDA